MATSELKCHRCIRCDGHGCPGMMPGLGGVMEGKNFQLNCQAWSELRQLANSKGKIDRILDIEVTPEHLRCGPVTGAVENIGYAAESDFYLPYLKNAAQAGIGLCVGDGCPDEKLKLGVEAVKKIKSEVSTGSTSASVQNSTSADIDVAFFLKPYPQEKLLERIEWVKPYANYIGMDIDSYNILTMRNLVHLEQKTAEQIEEIRAASGVPFVIKGVFTEQDLDLIRDVRPDVVYISNHGGRVETRIGSTGHFLAEHVDEIKEYCKEIWIDGGIRTVGDVQTALFYGADKVIVARPLIRATFDGKYTEEINKLLGK